MKHARILIFLLTVAFSVRGFGAGFPAVDTAIVNVYSMDTTDFPVQLIYDDGVESKFIQAAHHEKGKYHFAIPVNDYGKAEIYIQSPYSILMNSGGFIPQPRASILIGGGKAVNVTANFKDQLDIKVESTDPEIMLYESYAGKERKSDALSWKKIKERSAKDVSDETKASINKSLEKISAQMHVQKLAFVKQHKSSFAALEVFSTYYQGLSTNGAFSELQSIGNAYKEAPLWQSLYKKLSAGVSSDVGSMIPSFTGVDMHGKAFKSKQLRGKYFLVDFWGSWCMPCRKSHPALKALYAKYHDKGFEIVGVAFESGSAESQQKQWQKAVDADGLNWINLLNSTAGNMVQQFGVTSFPTKLLVDPEGRIVFRGNEGMGQIDRILAAALK